MGRALLEDKNCKNGIFSKNIIYFASFINLNLLNQNEFSGRKTVFAKYLGKLRVTAAQKTDSFISQTSFFQHCYWVAMRKNEVYQMTVHRGYP